MGRPSTPRPLSYTAASSSDDKRIDQVSVQAAEEEEEENGITAGIGTRLASAQTRAAFTATDGSASEERGIVHLYREAEETPGLYMNRNDRIPSHLWDGSASVRTATPGTRTNPPPPPRDDECTILAILAVPSYMTPKDFLAFVGPDTRNAVSHFRMIRTSRLNRYMVLMKFKDGRFARQWQHDWNGKVFNSMEPETCHVVFVRSVEVLHNEDLKAPREGPGIAPLGPGRSTLVSANKPLAPPTPSLVELPTCPVCLERMDESTGLWTVLCQHVFHCSCLEKWSGGGCPVCRYVHDDFSVAKTRPNTKKKYDEHRGEFEIEDDGELECGVCHITQSLWQCLICGYVGCGRFAGKHAMDHYKRTGHTFSIDLENQRVWDYDRDCYVHRIIANGSSAAGEKLVELPGRRRENEETALQDLDQDIEIAKRENLAFEYTQLLTSQLESQRIYFEEVVARAVDKAAEASKRANQAASDNALTKSELDTLRAELKELLEAKDQAERAASRFELRSQKLEELKRHSESEHETTKRLLESISTNAKARELAATAQRNELFKQQAATIQDLKNELATRNFFVESLQEQCRDLRMQLDAHKQLQNLVQSGQLSQADLDGATVEVAPTAPQPSPSLARPVRASRGPKALRTASKRQPEACPSTPPRDPTDEEITETVDTSKTVGSIASLLMDQIGQEYYWRSHTTEGDIIRCMMKIGYVIKNPDGGFELSCTFNKERAINALKEANLAQMIEDVSLPESLARALKTIGPEYELAAGKSGADIQQALIDSGILQRRTEEGLYDSDVPQDGRSVDAADTAERTKKKKKNRKKR